MRIQIWIFLIILSTNSVELIFLIIFYVYSLFFKYLSSLPNFLISHYFFHQLLFNLSISSFHLSILNNIITISQNYKIIYIIFYSIFYFFSSFHISLQSLLVRKKSYLSNMNPFSMIFWHWIRVENFKLCVTLKLKINYVSL